jgi:hypothetical protein
MLTVIDAPRLKPESMVEGRCLAIVVARKLNFG